MREEEAHAHARGYAFDVLALLEDLLRVWPRYSGRNANPYPEDMHNLLRDATTQPLRKRLFAFFRRHVLFCMGNAGWRRKVWKGFEPIGSQEEFTWMLRERQVAMMWINEAYTTIA